MLAMNAGPRNGSRRLSQFFLLLPESTALAVRTVALDCPAGETGGVFLVVITTILLQIYSFTEGCLASKFGKENAKEAKKAKSAKIRFAKSNEDRIMK
jgi:hypothetical protein